MWPILQNLKQINNPKTADNICSNLNIPIFEKQKLLETHDVRRRLEKMYELIEKETSVISVEKLEEGQKSNGKTQREYYLNEQLKAIRRAGRNRRGR